MQSKRGAIEIQFNWLFVMIIGAVILILFTTIILKQKDASELSQSSLVSRNLDAIFSGSEVSQGTVNVVQIPNTKVEFMCNRYSIGRTSRPLEVMNVFTPSVIEGNRLITMTRDWSVPFRITNILYLTNPQYRYILIGSDELSTEIVRMMPNETFVEVTDSLEKVDYDGENKVRIVYINQPVVQTTLPIDFSDVSDDSLTAVHIQGNLDSGTLSFYIKNDNSLVQDPQQSYYIKKETALGAVYSDERSIYECVMNNMFSKLNLVSEIYNAKTLALRTSYDPGSRCDQAKNLLYQTSFFTSLTSAQYSLAGISQALAAESQISSQNERAKDQSCATIY